MIAAPPEGRDPTTQPRRRLSRSMRDSLSNALRHQVAIVILEARTAIEVDRAPLVAFDF